MNNDKDGLINFTDLGGLDPAISSVLGGFERQEQRKSLSPEERKKLRKKEQKQAKERRRMQQRAENRVTLDLPSGMKARLEEIASEESINVSQLAAFLIAYALREYPGLPLSEHKTSSRTPKHDFNLAAPGGWWKPEKPENEGRPSK
ncbi:MAG TPA: hypothetical protein VI729_04495 [Anaerolineales bacterium]|nr:hypothetical protein [Anaerolineales bacterium]